MFLAGLSQRTGVLTESLMNYEVLIDGQSHHVELRRAEHGWQCRLDGEAVEVDAMIVRPNVLSLILKGAVYEILQEETAGDFHLSVKDKRFVVELLDARSLRSRRPARGNRDGPQSIVAPMAGRVVRVIALTGTEVEAGQGVLVIEAMKMQNELKALKKGTVKRVLVSEGSAVNAGDVLAVVE